MRHGKGPRRAFAARIVKMDNSRLYVRALVRSAGSSKTGLSARRVDDIEQSEGNVFVMRPHHCRGDHTGVRSRPGFRRACPEVAQDGDAPLAHDLFGDFMHGGEHAANSAGRCVVRHGAMGNREMGFLDESSPVDLELNILAPCGRTALEWRVDQGLQDVPEFGPTIAHGVSKAPRVFAPHNRAVRIVIDRDIFRPPPKELGKTVRQKNRHYCTKRGRPVLWRSERRGSPVQRADEFAHLAGGHQVIERGVWSRSARHDYPPPGTLFRAMSLRYTALARNAYTLPSEAALGRTFARSVAWPKMTQVSVKSQRSATSA